MEHFQFAQQATKALDGEKDILGLAVGGSWIHRELDEYSDLDLIVVTRNTISQRKENMLFYAQKLGPLLSAFTGEHVGEPRLLICLYDHPLLHVDIKFVSLEEFKERVENPHILLDKEGVLQRIMEQTTPHFPQPDFQWIEDRFWTWIHYALLKVGRGEYMEAFDFLGYLRMVVLGPLLHLKNNNLPRGVRKVESTIPKQDLHLLVGTLPSYTKPSLLSSLKNAVELYKSLRTELYYDAVNVNYQVEEKVMEYFAEIEARGLDN